MQKRMIALGFLAMVLLLTANKMFFMHTHTLTNGEVVVHAHPYQKTTPDNSNNGHTHNAFELMVIDSMQHFLFAAFAFGILLCIHYQLRRNFELNKKINPFKVFHRFGRAPPVM